MLDAASLLRGYLLAILICNYRAFCRTSIRSKNDPIFEETAHNCRSRAGRFWQRDTSVGQERIASRESVVAGARIN